MPYQNQKTHREQSYFIPIELRQDLAAILGIELIGDDQYLPPNLQVEFLLDGNHLVVAATNAYCSAKSNDLRAWFNQNNVGAIFNAYVDADGRIVLMWV
jgi:hypothetical protein